MPVLVRAEERLSQIAWVLDHDADLDADFLAVYGIDLEVNDITGPRYFALAHRLPAYTGVMAARVEEERDKGEDRPSTRSTEPQQDDDGRKEVTLTAFQVMFPGIVSGGTGGG